MSAAVTQDVDLMLTLQPTDTATFEVMSHAGQTGIATKVMAAPDGPRLFVIVATTVGIVGAALDEADAEAFAVSLARARQHLAAGDVGGRRN